MNREIKFRIKIDDEIIYVSLDEMLNDGEQYVDACYEFLGQYTGLKDKNSKEIYEGDIIEYEEYHDGKRYPNKDRHLVQKRQGYFSCCDLDTSTLWKVIGNIHENPELMKGDTNG
jgi:hypothetical protein